MVPCIMLNSEINPTRCNNCCILLDLFHYFFLLVTNPPYYMGPKGSFPCSQRTSTSYPEPLYFVSWARTIQFSTRLIVFLEGRFNVIHPSKSACSKLCTSPHISLPKPCIHPSSSPIRATCCAHLIFESWYSVVI